MLDQLNDILKTSYRTSDEPHLPVVLQACISNNYDFSTAYGRLRRRWYKHDWSHFLDILHTHEIEDTKMRQDALVGNRIVSPNIPPRRVWDLYSNRVVPYWIIKRWLWGISHAWIDEKDRVSVWTPINGHERPVPIPKDANLDLIRLELLNLGAEYVWLDVLCLRQECGLREDLRAEEWKLDRPTIGHVYRMATEVVCYFSGLGRPWILKEGDLDSDWSWFRRAWTLQDVGKTMIIAGDTPDSPLHAKPPEQDRAYEEMLLRVQKQLESSKDMMWGERHVFDVLADMQKRVSTQPVDKIAGLAFPLQSVTILAYYELGSLEDAWVALVDTMGAKYRAQLFLLYPEPGDARKKWCPSWKQVTEKPVEVYGSLVMVTWDEKPLSKDAFHGVRDEEEIVNCHALFCIENVLVQNLAVGDAKGFVRHGRFVVADEKCHSFNAIAPHQYPIPEGTYTLICAHMETGYWVVGKGLLDDHRMPIFEKVSVFEKDNRYEIEALIDLGVAKRSSVFLV
ncbi:uncharacterized protein ARMOST_18536 [Armillaria ostoyae]|uniref:Heterokaryon incompatibility domain-containing protein n=1 Tax=Armillaria ostoyae TaxID=47428 RepID=A0A284S246_ARMOS|nr:uncharacterized protein ARMOST_18536 [Armillaria ostoyae]